MPSDMDSESERAGNGTEAAVNLGMEKILENAGLRLRPIQYEHLVYPPWKPVLAVPITEATTASETKDDDDETFFSSGIPETAPFFWNRYQIEVADSPPPNPDHGIARILQWIIFLFCIINIVVGYYTIQEPGGLLFLLPFIIMNVIFAGIFYWKHVEELPVKICAVGAYLKFLIQEKLDSRTEAVVKRLVVASIPKLLLIAGLVYISLLCLMKAIS